MNPLAMLPPAVVGVLVSLALATGVPAAIIALGRRLHLRRHLRVVYGLAGLVAVVVPLLELGGPTPPAADVVLATITGLWVWARYKDAASRHRWHRQARH